MNFVKRFVPLLLVCTFLMAIPAGATDSDRASAQISSYYINAAAIRNGQIGIDFSVTCPGNMKEVGAQEIYVYEIAPGGLVEKAHYDSGDLGMSSTDTWVHADYIIFPGVIGRTYYITVTIYATDYNNRSDSRSKSFTVTAT